MLYSTSPDTRNRPMTLAERLAELIGSQEEWQRSALCAQADPDSWFPERGGTTKDVKRICGRCPVRQECLEYALLRREPYGVWGGMSERDRRRILRNAA